MPATALIGKVKRRMNRFSRYAAFIPPGLLFLGFGVDIFLWTAHPFAMLVGHMAGVMIDPLIIFPSLVVGIAMRPDWRAVAAALVIGGLVELLSMNNPVRMIEGRVGFDAVVWLVRSLGSCTIIALLGIGKLILGRERGDQ